MIQAIHALLVALPAYTLEPTPEDADARAVRLEPVAGAIWEASAANPGGFTRGQWAAVITALAWHESRFARYVQAGQCETGPVGARCDNGKARGLWQQHQSACPQAWATTPGSAEDLQKGAQCASRLLGSALHRCRSRAPSVLFGAFSGYAGASCTWGHARKREATAWQFARRLGA